MVTRQDVVNAAMTHLGQARQTDAWNGDHPVEMMCQADVEDWYTEAGLQNVKHFPTAAAAGDAAPLNAGHAPAGAQVFFRGPGWSPFDHTGVSLGNGKTISGLTVVTVTDGWQDLATYRGWRDPAGLNGAGMPGGFIINDNPYGQIPMQSPFSNRWQMLNEMGLALPMMGYPMMAERTLAGGRRVQKFERGWYGTQPAASPWDLVALMLTEIPPG